MKGKPSCHFCAASSRPGDAGKSNAPRRKPGQTLPIKTDDPAPPFTPARGFPAAPPPGPMILVIPGVDFRSVSRKMRLPIGPVDTGKVRKFDANAPQSCSLPLGFFAGITEGGTEGLFVRTMNRRNKIIATAVERGFTFKDGRIVNPQGKVLSAHKKDGYMFLWLPVPGVGGIVCGMARVVCWLYHGPQPPGKPCVDHINRIRDDNRPENLRWVTYGENNLNISEEHRQVRVRRMDRIRPYGEKSPNAKLNLEQVREILASKESQRLLGRKYGVSQKSISRIKRGERWAVTISQHS